MFRRFSIVFLAGFLIAGCGSGASDDSRPDLIFSDSGGPWTPSDDTAQPNEDAKDPWRDVQGPRDIDSTHALDIFFLHDTSVTLEVGIGGGVNLSFMVYDRTAGGPAIGARVGLLLEPEDGGDGYLMAQQVFTGAEGRGTVRFAAGEIAPACYTVRATVTGAEDTIDVCVTPRPTGDLRVSLSYDGALGLQDIKIHVMEAGRFQCNHFDPTRADEIVDGENQLPLSQYAMSITSATLFEDLEADTRYAVFVTANWAGHLAASGCDDSIWVVGNTTNIVTVDLNELFLNPVGSYDMIATFDFTGAIPGQVGEIIDLVVELFWDPGQFVIDMVMLVVDIYLGQWVGQIIEWALGLFEDAIIDAINDWVFNNSPDWVQDFIQIGQDVTQIIAHLEVIADLHIAKPSGDGSWVQGREDFIGIALYWHLGCPDENDPDYDPQCGRIEFSMQELADQNMQFPLDIVSGVWDGAITNYNRLLIQNHPIQINYGRLILFVFNELVLPMIQGTTCSTDRDCGTWSICDSSGHCEYHSLTDAVHGFVNCNSLGDWVDDGILGELGIDGDDVSRFCDDAIDFVVGPIVSIVYNLSLDSRMRMHGEATFWDDDDDLFVDRIEDGTFFGNIEIDGQANAPQFDAVWRATRKP